MQIQQLRYLIAAAEHESLRSAAASLYISQSSLSVAIKDLERETGTTVFERSSRGVTLTNEGAELLGYARQIIEQVDLMQARYARGNQGAQVKFAVSSQHYSLVAEAFGDLVERHMDKTCEFNLRETYTNEVIRDVSSGRAQVGVIYLSNYNDRVIKRALDTGSLTFTSLFVARPHVFVSKNHPLAKRKTIRLEELSSYHRFEHEQGIESSSYYSEEPLSSIPHTRNIVLSDNATLTGLLARIEGYTLATGIFPTNGTIVPIPLETDEIMNVGFVERSESELTTLCEEFLELLCARVRSYEGNIEKALTVYNT